MGTLNDKKSDEWFDYALWEAKQRATKNELKVFTFMVSNFTTKVLHVLWI